MGLTTTGPFLCWNSHNGPPDLYPDGTTYAIICRQAGKSDLAFNSANWSLWLWLTVCELENIYHFPDGVYHLFTLSRASSIFHSYVEILVTRASSIGPCFIFRSPVHHYGDHGDHHHELLNNDIHVLHDEFHFLGDSEMGGFKGSKMQPRCPRAAMKFDAYPLVICYIAIENGHL